MANSKVDDTILKIITNFKGYHEKTNFSFGSSSKRSFSLGSSDSHISLMETPAKKIKEERNVDLNYIGSPREVRRIRADLLEARNSIRNLENRMQHMHNVRKEMEIMYENETKSLKKQQEYDRKVIEDLETQLQSFRHKKTELEEQLTDVNIYFSLICNLIVYLIVIYSLEVNTTYSKYGKMKKSKNWKRVFPK